MHFRVPAVGKGLRRRLKVVSVQRWQEKWILLTLQIEHIFISHDSLHLLGNPPFERIVNSDKSGMIHWCDSHSSMFEIKFKNLWHGMVISIFMTLKNVCKIEDYRPRNECNTWRGGRLSQYGHLLFWHKNRNHEWQKKEILTLALRLFFDTQLKWPRLMLMTVSFSLNSWFTYKKRKYGYVHSPIVIKGKKRMISARINLKWKPGKTKFS